MIKLSKKKTSTFGTDFNPLYTLLIGHVGSRAFNEAYKKEGWNDDKIFNDQLSHLYVIINKDNIKFSLKKVKGSIPVTCLDQ